MKILLTALLSFLLVTDAWSASKEKKTYVAKTKKSVKYKKKSKKRVYIRKYPIRSNTLVSGDELKLQEMVKDLYE